MNYSDIHQGMRVRPVELFGELDQIEALHLNPGTVVKEPEGPELTVDPDPEIGECKNMIKVLHDDGRVMHHTADQLEVE